MNDVVKVDTFGRATYFREFAGFPECCRVLWMEKLVPRLALSRYFPFGNSLILMIGSRHEESERGESERRLTLPGASPRLQCLKNEGRALSAATTDSGGPEAFWPELRNL